MPRMPKKRKQELSFFLNERGRVTYNDLCRKCQRTCKQSFRAVIVDCPHYLCALPGASCGKRMIDRSVPAPANHHRGSYTSPALAAASYPFVDLPPGNTLRCKLFSFSKFTILLFPKVTGHSIIKLATNRN